MARRLLPFLLAIVLLAFALRLHNLTSSSFWQDEGLTPLRASYPLLEILSNRITIQEGVSRDTHPPLYYLLIHFTQMLFGRSDFAYRFPSVLAGVLLIPLLFQFGRHLHSLSLALLVALLAAVNPLQIWYAQEARMYPLFVLLAAATSYTLWRALRQHSPTGRDLYRWLALYVLLAGMAFYTHYTAFFLIAGQSPFWFWLLWRNGQRRLLLAAALIGFFITLPLLPIVIPRFFTGAEANYIYVPPWIILYDIIRAFGFGLTVDFQQWSIKLLEVGLLILLLAGIIGPPQSREKRRLSRLLLLCYLLAVVFGLMFGSLFKPMYLGARHIMAGSPAFLLLLARGWIALPQRPVLLAPIAAIVILFLGPVVSLHNLYSDPTYRKDDLRALIRYVEQRAGSRDVMLYNNAILMATHWHYQQRQDLPVTALPVYPHPAGATTEAQIETLAQQFDRIWFVEDLPADGRDDGQLVRRWIKEHLTPLELRDFHSRTMGVVIFAYGTKAVRSESLPADSQSLDLSWPDLPPLRGVRYDFSQPAALPTLWLDLFWAGGEAPANEKRLRFVLRSNDGWHWLDVDHAFRSEPGRSWPESGLVRVSYALPVSPGTPPGEYQLLLQPWDGNNSDEWQEVANVSLAESNRWPITPDWPFKTKAPLYFANGLVLRGLSHDLARVRPGHALPISLYWQRNSNSSLTADLRYHLEVVGPDGQIVRSQSEPIAPAWLAPGDWPPEAIIARPIGLYFPPETAPGRYRLRWRLLAGDTSIGGRAGWRPWPNDSFFLGQVQVLGWPLVTKPPATAQVIQASFGPAIELYGYELADGPLQPGGSLGLTLYWRARAAPEENYVTFVHLVNAADGSIVSQQDRIPVAGLRLTKGWRPGEILTDSYQLALPADLAAGEYRLNVGLWQPDTGARLPIIYQGEPQPNDQLLLTTVTVP